MLVALLFSVSAHAGWFSSFCEKYLVQDYPYEYEEVSDVWLAREAERLELKKRWNKLGVSDEARLELMRREEALRAHFKETYPEVL